VTSVVDQGLISIMRWLLVGTIGLYFVPLIFYWLLFQKIGPLCEVLIGYCSFLFFTPTYLNIMNIYSLCRMDDISWGTKGLDTNSGKNANLIGSWKLIKFIHVFKYVLWNIIVAAVLLTMGSGYQTRFFVSFAMVCLIGSTMALKIFLSLLYLLRYKTKAPKMS
jgi:chitin synthase